MEAHITVAGNVGGDVVWREVENYEGGKAMFRVAVTPRVRRGGVWGDGTTTWYRVTCWRYLAARVRESIRKGDAVVVRGRLLSDRWTDVHGIERDSFDIEADWVGHDLRCGRTAFTRVSRQRDADAPLTETDHEAERARAEADADAAADADADRTLQPHAPDSGPPADEVAAFEAVVAGLGGHRGE